MSFLRSVPLDDAFPPFAAMRRSLGYVPGLFRAQTLVPRVLEAEARLVGAIQLEQSALSRIQKESLLLSIAAARDNPYCVAAHRQALRMIGADEERIDGIACAHRRAGLSEADRVLLDFGLKLALQPTWVCIEDLDVMRRHGFTDEQILDGVLMTALAEHLCTLSIGLGAKPDFEPMSAAREPERPPWGDTFPAAHPPGSPGHEMPRGYLKTVEMSAEVFPPFAFFRERFGFVPGIFRAQTLRPEVVEAEAGAMEAILLGDGVLSRIRKEQIMLAISAANLNTCCVALHTELLRGLGIPDDRSDPIAVDHHAAALSPADAALLDFALKIRLHPSEFRREDVESLREHLYTEEQILEAVVTTALATFFNTIQMGLGTIPDFPPRRKFPVQVNLFHEPEALTRGVLRPTGRAEPAGDEDEALVARAREGDRDAFEDLVRRHHRRVYRTLVGITGNLEDAEDVTQMTFLKAFEHLGNFQGASKFSTWLTRIAINEGLQRVRGRRPMVSLDQTDDDGDEGFRPRQLRAWTDNPEEAVSKNEMRALVEKELMKLPPKYRLAVMLRDLEELTTEEAAQALGLGIAVLKTRLLRGRLMLRERLAPHFIAPRENPIRA